MNYSSVFDLAEIHRFENLAENASFETVASVLSREKHSPEDFAILLSQAAMDMECREIMARKTHAITERRFGRVIQLYIPLYLSNECVNECLYCGYRHDRNIPRLTLTPDEAFREAEKIRSLGFSHILLLTGTGGRNAESGYLEEVIKKIKSIFSSVSLEIETLDEPGYIKLHDAGAEGVTVYQETYDPEIFKVVHPKGPKKDFNSRLDAPDRIGRAGFRKINIGSLLGLNDWRFEAISLMMHCRYLLKQYWQSQISVSFPRITNHPADFKFTPVTNPELVQMIMAFRLAFPDVNLVISTREKHDFRMNLLKLGITQISAGSKTSPGGYIRETHSSAGQFITEDRTSPEDVAKELVAMGYEPVWKDWEGSLS